MPTSVRHRAARWAVLVAAALAAACRGNPYGLVQRMVPREDAVAREFLAAVRAGNLARAEELIAPAKRGAQARRSRIVRDGRWD